MRDLYLMLYNFGFEEDVPPLSSQLDTAKELGFQGVELIRPVDAETEKLLKAAGLKLIEGQKSLNAAGELQNIALMQSLGVRFIGGEEGYNDRDSALWVAEQLNALGKLCRPYGFKTVTHNHTGEFAFNEKDNEYCWETVAKNTDPDLVSFKLDIGWASIAGVDCNYLIRKYPGRVELVHVKPATKILGVNAMNTRKLGFGSKDPGAKQTSTPSMPDIGSIMKHVSPAQGPMKDFVFNLQDIMETAEQYGAKAFILERDCFYTDRVQVMREDAAFIRTYW